MPADYATLLHDFRAGDARAFDDLFEAQVGLLSAHIRPRMAPLLRRKVSVADVLQEARIVAFQKREAFEGRTVGEFRNWLMAIADHKIRQAVEPYVRGPRRALIREVSRDERADTSCAQGTAPSPSQQAIAAEFGALARQAYAKLSNEHREIIRLVREEELSLREVARRRGCSYEAAKKQHQRALFEYTESFRHLRGGDHE